uniref:Uncharacterized protein n=1 Tax=Arundo donax TaxID=35708 RepID=A0A0A9ELD3_ARUDO
MFRKIITESKAIQAAMPRLSTTGILVLTIRR